MARPREFDINKAVQDAMGVFWKKGYQGSSLPELLEGMGIVRGSFYKAFGSKKALFVKALELYDKLYVQPAVAKLSAADGNGDELIAGVFENTLAAAAGGDRRGCLLCNSAAESSFDDKDIAMIVNRQIEQLTKGFQAALNEDPEFQPTSDQVRQAEARRLCLNYVGLRIMQRSGQDIEAMKMGVARR